MPHPSPSPAPRHEDAAVRDVLTAGVAEQHAALRAWGLPPVRLLVLYNPCAFRCFFCASAGTSDRAADDRTPWAQIAGHLSPALPEEQGRLIVAGNEPLLHPDFDRLMDLAADRAFHHIELMTSGTPLSDPARRTRWIQRGLRAVAVPLYAAVADEHDAVVGAPAWDGLVAALDAAHAEGVRVEVHSLALRRTANALLPLARMVQARWGTTLAIAPLRDKEGQFDWAREALPLDALADRLAAWPTDVGVRLVGFPFCVAPEAPRGAADTIGLYFRTQRRAFAPLCAACTARPRCPGVVEAQLRQRGDAGLSPFRAPSPGTSPGSTGG